MEEESLQDWFDRGWNGKIDPIDYDLLERLQARGEMLDYVRANYGKFYKQQKRRVKGQGNLF